MRQLMLTWLIPLPQKQQRKTPWQNNHFVNVCMYFTQMNLLLPQPTSLNHLLPVLVSTVQMSRCPPLPLTRWPDRTQASKATSLTSCDTVQSASSCVATITCRSAVPYSLWWKAANKFVHQFSTCCVFMSDDLCRANKYSRLGQKSLCDITTDPLSSPHFDPVLWKNGAD